MSKPLVSVYMSVRNGGPYLAHAINSVRAQAYRNWELIVVDDGSTDETVDYLKNLALEGDWIKVVFTGGVGRAKALNLAVSHAAGDYIANLDADDVAHPLRLEVQVELMKIYQLRFLASAAQFIRNSEVAEWENVEVDGCQITDRSRMLLRKNPVGHSSVIMEKSLFQKVGGYSEDLTSQVDYELWFRICLSGHPISRSSPALVAKRLHENQSFERQNRVQYVWNSYKIQKAIIAGLHGGWMDRCSMFLRLCGGLVPASIRLSRR